MLRKFSINFFSLFIFGFFVVFSCIFFISSCKKEKNSPALLFITPETTYYDVVPSYIIKFDISGSSETALLTGFSVVSNADNAFSVTVFDSTFSAKVFKMSYEYQVPVFSQSINITLQFILNDENGNQTRVAKILRVTVASTLPAETTGNEFFSAISGKQDAYNLFNIQPLFSQSSGVTSQHIKDATEKDSLITVDTLSKKWISPAGFQFVRFNDFDYANATHTDLKNAYEAGIKKSFVDKLADGDIILTRFPNSETDKGYIAIKIVSVIEKDSTDLDRYIFNFKK